MFSANILRTLVPLAPLMVLCTILAFDERPESHHGVGNPSQLRLDPLPAPHEPAYPLRVAADRRYLEDSTGQPFFVKGDTAWSLIAELKRDDIDLYLRDRRARGFNTLLVTLIEHRFATNAPANAYGDVPFKVAGRFDTPNEAYFAYAEWVVRRAAEEGFLVLLTPCFTGSQGGDEGWYREMEAAGPERLRDYGRYVGRRFAKFDNIIWVANGDYDAPDRGLVRAIVDGVRDAEPKAIFTSHNAMGTSGTEYWPGEDWVGLNNVYTWGAVFPQAVSQYAREPVLPYILIESNYENAPNIPLLRVRSQAYQVLLTGAAGHVFGNCPIWYFDGTDDFPIRSGWRAALDGPGSRNMAILHRLLDRLPWTQLEPDVSGKLLVAGEGADARRAVAARARDGSMAILYIPQDRTVAVDLSQLAGPKVRAFWYDPTAGTTFEALGSELQPQTIEKFRPFKRNASAAGDWLLILQAER